MTVDRDHLKVFGARAGRELATDLCEHLDLPLGVAETELFPETIDTSCSQ